MRSLVALRADPAERFRIGFIAVLLGCFFPSRTLAYAFPLVFTVWMLSGASSTIARSRVALCLAVSIAGCLLFALVADEFLVVNYFLAMLTYSAALPIIALDNRDLASPILLRRMLVASSRMLAFQGAFGIAQALVGAIRTGTFGAGNGDIVAGSIRPGFQPVADFSNPVFTVNVLLIVFACIPLPAAELPHKRRILTLGVAAAVLASVVHVLAFALAAVIVGYVLTRPRATNAMAGRSSRGRGLAALLLACGLALLVVPEELTHSDTMVSRALDLEALEVPRAILVYRVITELPADAPAQPYVGLGPGQFCSRAALIASGLYLGGPDANRGLPFMEPQATRRTIEYCGSLLIAFADQMDQISSTHQPFSSWLSLYCELGLLGVIVFVVVVWRVVRAATKHARRHPGRRLQAWMFCTGTGFIVLLGIQENYWEVPQAILIGLLLLKVMYANLIYGDDSSRP